MEEKYHAITIENRKRITVSCCDEVASLNENEVVLFALDCKIVIRGEGLGVEEVSKQSGEAVVTGNVIESVTYAKGHKKSSEGMLRRMFK